MELFDIEAGKVVLDPNVLYIPEFKKLWDRDKTEGHDIATKEIAYITYLCSFSSRNPYNVYAEKDKEKKVRKDTIGKIGREPDKEVNDALKRYREYQSTPTTRLLEGAFIAADVLAEYFKNAADHGATEVMRNLKELGNTVKSLYSLKEQVQKEQLESQEVRGGSEIGMYELPDEDIEE
jgi:hypothetical protein